MNIVQTCTNEIMREYVKNSPKKGNAAKITPPKGCGPLPPK